MLVKLIIPELVAEAPRKYHCDHCGGILHAHAVDNHRQIIDTRLRKIQQRRFRCTRCGKTFPSYPKGISKGAQRSDRVKALGVMLYILGLSYRGAASVVKGLVGKTCASTVYNDVQRVGARAWEAMVSRV